MVSYWKLFAVFAAFILPLVDAKYPLSGVHTGINTQTGARPARRNVLDFQNDLPSWSLYIQALSDMQKVPEDDLLSWFQVAGIHGRPYYAWDGYEHVEGAPEIGYCTHDSILFPIWHRPYVALVEQILASYVQERAKTYTSDPSTYQAAADNFRVPYWDWAAPPFAMPAVVTAATVQINTPSGLQTVDNPLLFYAFQEFPLNATWFPAGVPGEGILSTYNTTVRSDGSNLGGFLQTDVFEVFTQSTTFNIMATGQDAFEYPHNLVHQAVGGSTQVEPLGHMASFPYSAFDPIFMLVHCNVDRLFTMWQAINPGQLLTSELDNSLGTFTIINGTTIDTVDTPLTPFTMADGQTPYTTTSAWNTSVFGYSYPEVQDWLPQTPTQLAASVWAQVQTLYNVTTSS